MTLFSFDVRQFSSLQPYGNIFEQMRTFTAERTEKTPDAFWLLEHFPVFTQGQAGKPEHVLAPGDIPVIQSDRGGQVTYHGPGQLMIYSLFDIKRRNSGIKAFTQYLQKSIIALLKQYEISAEIQCDAPGVYVKGAKICSIGLRVRQGRTYHGMSLNVNMDLSPFKRINPCGVHQLEMTQISHFVPRISVATVIETLIPVLREELPWLLHLEKSVP